MVLFLLVLRLPLVGQVVYSLNRLPIHYFISFHILFPAWGRDFFLVVDKYIYCWGDIFLLIWLELLLAYVWWEAVEGYYSAYTFWFVNSLYIIFIPDFVNYPQNTILIFLRSYFRTEDWHFKLFLWDENSFLIPWGYHLLLVELFQLYIQENLISLLLLFQSF